jgi:hypothetical protein
LIGYMAGAGINAKGEVKMDPITVENYMRWGKLIKTWATGRSYFVDDSPSITIDQLPIPRTIEELKAQIALVGAGVVVPPDVTGLAVIQYSPDTLVIRLPPKERVEAKEAELGSEAGVYPFPDFYRPSIGQTLSVEQKLNLHACRIGDYTISLCG